jgi:hypothetical protein
MVTITRVLKIEIVLEQHAYSASSLKQQSIDRHVAPLRQIILISSNPSLSLFLKAAVKKKPDSATPV